MPYMHRVRLVLVASLSMFVSVAGFGLASSPAHAQVEPVSEPPAEVWLSRTLAEQRRMDKFGRYAAAPVSIVLGGATALLPAVLDTSLASSIAYLGTTAFMLTSAVSLWANEDPDEARRQYAFWGSLGFSAFGAGLILSCATQDEVCPRAGLGRRLQVGVGAFEAGFFVSNAILALFMPPPSASALELSVKNLSGPGRHARVLEFLERRDRQRRVAAYISAPWGLAFGSFLLVEAAGADTTEAKAWLYGLGGSLLAFNLVAFLYDQLRRGDADRLRAGEYP